MVETRAIAEKLSFLRPNMNAAQASNVFVTAYGVVKRTGLLDVPLVRRGFHGAYFMYKRWIEDPFAPFIQKFPDLFADGHVLDIGANLGYTSVTFARALTPGFKVFAFEPDPKNFADFQAIVARSNYRSCIVPIQSAVGASDGNIDLWINEKHHADHRVATEHFTDSNTFKTSQSPQHTVKVPLLSIDHFLAGLAEPRTVAFIKIDVQGYELEVLRGMTETLARNPNVSVAFEYTPESIESLGYQPKDIFKFFEDRGYNLHIIERTGIISNLEDTVTHALISKRGYFDCLATRRPVS